MILYRSFNEGFLLHNGCFYIWEQVNWLIISDYVCGEPLRCLINYYNNCATWELFATFVLFWKNNRFKAIALHEIRSFLTLSVLCSLYTWKLIFEDLFKSLFVYYAPKSDVKFQLTYCFNDFDVYIHILHPHNCITPIYIFRSYGFYFDTDFAYKWSSYVKNGWINCWSRIEKGSSWDWVHTICPRSSPCFRKGDCKKFPVSSFLREANHYCPLFKTKEPMIKHITNLMKWLIMFQLCQYHGKVARAWAYDCFSSSVGGWQGWDSCQSRLPGTVQPGIGSV